MNGRCLSISTLLLLFPIIIFYSNSNKTILEFILAFLLTNNIIISFLFWKNPIKNSLLHYCDGIFAKISYVLFPIYILFIKDIDYFLKIIFTVIFLLSSTLFYYSNYHSKESWCSKKHIIYHSLFHILIGIGTTFAFI